MKPKDHKCSCGICGKSFLYLESDRDKTQAERDALRAEVEHLKHEIELNTAAIEWRDNMLNSMKNNLEHLRADLTEAVRLLRGAKDAIDMVQEILSDGFWPTENKEQWNDLSGLFAHS